MAETLKTKATVRRSSEATILISNFSSPGTATPRVKKSYKRLSVPLPLGDNETSPRQCDFCGRIRHTIPVAPPNSPGLPFLTKSCDECSFLLNVK